MKINLFPNEKYKIPIKPIIWHNKFHDNINKSNQSHSSHGNTNIHMNKSGLNMGCP